MIRRLLGSIISLYRPKYVPAVVYMLQSTEYHASPYLAWYWRTLNFAAVMHRRTLVPTKAARLLKLALSFGMVAQYAAATVCLWLWRAGQVSSGWLFALALAVSAPVVWAHAVVVPLVLGRIFIVNPRQKRLIAASEKLFQKHPAQKIAIAGSYGKTSMKELLLTVLSEGKAVAATPANKNVAISHALFAQKLSGKEEVLLIEYGEGQPGDVAQFAKITHPTIGVITGLAPAHLDQYKTLRAAGEDIFSLADALDHQNVYVNGDSGQSAPFIRPPHVVYTIEGVGDWKAEAVKVGFDGTAFTLTNGSRKLQLHSGLVGRHHIGPLALAAVLGLKLGLSEKQVMRGIAKTRPYEHRMAPRHLHGAWIIDDTYNGNIEGVRAGLSLLGELPAKRKIYVTPGLVDQGAETQAVHREMGLLIAAANPSIVVLMQNSVTPLIIDGLEAGSFQGEIVTEQDPLAFYTGLDAFIAAGDVVLMQNDWTDNYH